MSAKNAWTYQIQPEQVLTGQLQNLLCLWVTKLRQGFRSAGESNTH